MNNATAASLDPQETLFTSARAARISIAAADAAANRGADAQELEAQRPKAIDILALAMLDSGCGF